MQILGGAPGEYVSSFPGGTGELYQGQGRVQRWCSSSLASRCVANSRSDLQAESPGEVDRTFSQENWGCISVCCHDPGCDILPETLCNYFSPMRPRNISPPDHYSQACLRDAPYLSCVFGFTRQGECTGPGQGRGMFGSFLWAAGE